MLLQSKWLKTRKQPATNVDEDWGKGTSFTVAGITALCSHSVNQGRFARNVKKLEGLHGTCPKDSISYSTDICSVGSLLFTSQ